MNRAGNAARLLPLHLFAYVDKDHAGAADKGKPIFHRNGFHHGVGLPTICLKPYSNITYALPIPRN